MDRERVENILQTHQSRRRFLSNVLTGGLILSSSTILGCNFARLSPECKPQTKPNSQETYSCEQNIDVTLKYLFIKQSRWPANGGCVIDLPYSFRNYPQNQKLAWIDPDLRYNHPGRDPDKEIPIKSPPVRLDNFLFELNLSLRFGTLVLVVNLGTPDIDKPRDKWITIPDSFVSELVPHNIVAVWSDWEFDEVSWDGIKTKPLNNALRPNTIVKTIPGFRQN